MATAHCLTSVLMGLVACGTTDMLIAFFVVVCLDLMRNVVNCQNLLCSPPVRCGDLNS